jgi:hypothetical protein
MKRHGGPNRLRQACLQRQCQALERPAAAASRKVRERWSMLGPASSGASSHSEGEQQQQQTSANQRRKMCTSRRIPIFRPAGGGGEESESEGEESKGGRPSAAVRRPAARKLLLTVTKDLAPQLIRNLNEVKKEDEEKFVTRHEKESNWGHRAHGSTGISPPSTVSVAATGSTPSAAWLRVLAGASEAPAETIKSEVKPMER